MTAPQSTEQAHFLPGSGGRSMSNGKNLSIEEIERFFAFLYLSENLSALYINERPI